MLMMPEALAAAACRSRAEITMLVGRTGAMWPAAGTGVLAGRVELLAITAAWPGPGTPNVAGSAMVEKLFLFWKRREQQ